MGVLVEGISVIVRCDSINLKFFGGWETFISTIPNPPFCTDHEIVRIGFMCPQDVGSFVDELEKNGLCFISEDEAIDFAVVDQQNGPTTNCKWLQFVKHKLGENESVSACWFYEGERLGEGLHFHKLPLEIATPDGWKFEGSLSQEFTFIPNDQVNARLNFLQNNNSIDVFLDLLTGEEVYTRHSREK